LKPRSFGGDKLRVGQGKLRALQLQVCKPAESRVVFLNTLQGKSQRLTMARFRTFEEVLRLFFVMLQAGVSRQFFAIHSELSFVVAPGVRPNQAERRFVTFVVLFKVGTALSADWMRPFALRLF
jgi:hypothetical protein